MLQKKQGVLPARTFSVGPVDLCQRDHSACHQLQDSSTRGGAKAPSLSSDRPREEDSPHDVKAARELPEVTTVQCVSMAEWEFLTCGACGQHVDSVFKATRRGQLGRIGWLPVEGHACTVGNGRAAVDNR